MPKPLLLAVGGVLLLGAGAAAVIWSETRDLEPRGAAAAAAPAADPWARPAGPAWTRPAAGGPSAAAAPGAPASLPAGATAVPGTAPMPGDPWARSDAPGAAQDGFQGSAETRSEPEPARTYAVGRSPPTVQPPRPQPRDR